MRPREAQWVEGRDWRSWAACRDSDPELFFPEPTDEPLVRQQVAAAKAVCEACPVRPSCLEFALERLPYGVAGGLTEQERRRRRAGLSLGVREPRRWQALLAAGYSQPEIARECGVSTRTIARWISEQRAGVEAPAGGDRR